MMKFVFGKVENIMGKGENSGYQHFLPFPQCFQNTSSSGFLRAIRIKWVKSRIKTDRAS